MAAEFKIIASAETDKAAADIKGFANAAERDLKKFSQGGNVAATSVGKLNKAVANANPTLVNFGRVVQDAPFGIIGIANNIDPLISSFQSLKASTGSAGGAFKALGSALLGPAGIAIAVSAVTSALVAFGPEIKDAISGVGKFEGALRTASDEGSKAFIGAQQEFNKFSGTLNNANASLNQQSVALKGVNGLLSEYGLEINSVSAFQKVGNQVGLIYAQIKANEAKATAIASVAAEEYAENIKRLSGTTKAVTSIATGGFFSQLFQFAKLGPGGLLALGGSLEKIGKSADLQKNLNDETSRFRSENDALIKSLENIDGVTVKTNTTKKAAVDVTKELNTQWDNSIGKAVELKTGLQGLATQADIYAKTLAKVAAEEKAAAAARSEASQRELISPSAPNVNGRRGSVVATDSVTSARKNLQALAAETQAAADSINAAIASLAVDSLVGFASALGEALTSGDIAGGIKKFAGILGGAVSALGRQVLITSQVMVKLQAALTSGAFIGPLGIVAGLGLIAAGAALSSLANGGLKLARGGVVNSPTQALIGDGGAEAVIPLSQLSNIIGGIALQATNGGGGGLSIVRGQDIYYSNNNASRSFGRLFG